MNKMNTEIKLTVTEIQRFCMHDGPGIRTTVFFKGCPLRCVWCHNPETQKREKELLFYPSKCIVCRRCEFLCERGVHSFADPHTLCRESCVVCGRCADECPTRALDVCGREYTVKQILDVVERDRAFYGDYGGVTLSGGEPFAQGRAVIELLRACREQGISTAVETCGYTEFSLILEAIPYTDLFLWDIKDTNDQRHRKYVGVSYARIWENLRAVDIRGAKTRLRCILVNGINTKEEHYREIARLAASLKHCDGVDFIPYHAYAGTKSVFLGLPDNGNKSWVPTNEEMDHAKKIFKEFYSKT